MLKGTYGDESNDNTNGVGVEHMSHHILIHATTAMESLASAPERGWIYYSRG